MSLFEKRHNLSSGVNFSKWNEITQLVWKKNVKIGKQEL